MSRQRECAEGGLRWLWARVGPGTKLNVAVAVPQVDKTGKDRALAGYF